MCTEEAYPFKAVKLLRTTGDNDEAMVDEEGGWQVVCESTALFITDCTHGVVVPEDPTDRYLRLRRTGS